MKIIIGFIIYLISFNSYAITFKQMMKTMEIVIEGNYNKINRLIAADSALERGLKEAKGGTVKLIAESKVDHARVDAVLKEVETNGNLLEGFKEDIIAVERNVTQLLSLKDDMRDLESLEGDVRVMSTSMASVTQNLQSWPESEIPSANEIPDLDGDLTLRRCPNTLEFVWGYCTYSVGDRGPAGGIVVITTADGKNGVEISEEMPPAEYGCDRKKVKVPSKWGPKKTSLEKTELVASSELCGDGSLAKKSLDYAINGKDDWYLPSVDELSYIHENLDEIGVDMEGIYWAVGVSRYDPRRIFATSFDFNRGGFVDTERNSEENVRYLRRF